jgi:hypothetical protein
MGHKNEVTAGLLKENYQPSFGKAIKGFKYLYTKN